MLRNFFKDLSDEVILQILKKLPKKDLNTLAVTDKQFNSIVDDVSLKPTIKIADVTFTGKLLFFSVSRNSTIADLKKQIEDKIQIESYQQTLLFASKAVADNKKLHGYDDECRFLTLVKKK